MMVEKDSVFNLFIDEVSNPKSKVEDDVISTSSMKIGMFVKLIQNHKVFYKSLKKFINKEQPSYDASFAEGASKFMVFNRAWSFINQINIGKKEDILAILEFNPEILNSALQSTLVYYENREEYLKCAHILRIQQVLKEKENK